MMTPYSCKISWKLIKRFEQKHTDTHASEHGYLLSHPPHTNSGNGGMPKKNLFLAHCVEKSAGIKEYYRLVSAHTATFS
jgi:hypothetical protein